MAPVKIRLPAAFLLLVAAQAAHSLEEYFGELWQVLRPARIVSGLFSEDLSVGFAVANTLIVLLAVLCYFGPIRRCWIGAVATAWFWVFLEMANGIGHSLLALGAGGYFPGIYTAPLLVLSACLLAYVLAVAPDGGSAS